MVCKTVIVIFIPLSIVIFDEQKIKNAVDFMYLYSVQYTYNVCVGVANAKHMLKILGKYIIEFLFLSLVPSMQFTHSTLVRTVQRKIHVQAGPCSKKKTLIGLKTFFP